MNELTSLELEKYLYNLTRQTVLQEMRTQRYVSGEYQTKSYAIHTDMQALLQEVYEKEHPESKVGPTLVRVHE